MVTIIVGANGEISLRDDVLEHLGVRPGDKIAVEKLPSGRIEARAARASGQISDLFGVFKQKDGPRLSIDEMNEIIAQAWAGKR